MGNRRSPKGDEMSGRQQVGIIVFVVLCGWPALELAGFGMGISLSLPTALVCATIGGAFGGLLMCPRPAVAGTFGGLLAGPLGLFAVCYYTQHRESVWTLELVVVQLVASLPGYLVGVLLQGILTGFPTDCPTSADQTPTTRPASRPPCPGCGYESWYDGVKCSNCKYPALKAAEPDTTPDPAT
ncbi:unnamed protein product [Gemmata massiliana]|uniref:Uncharacterized protein n=1 Tax=Gemmata massiliana TaxID=1210884 RepID=A0A6P2D803_9BACT|nr:hypothetical protein [Gemmata massiliana]VTR96264.1 unnamed protein product [Gemmata massiliana]